MEFSNPSTLAGSPLGRITHTLRGRYLVSAVVLGALVVAGAWLTSRYVSSAIELKSAGIAARNELAHQARPLFDAHWRAEYALHSYALSPSKVARERVHEYLEDAVTRVDRLLAERLANSAEAIAELRALRADYTRLGEVASELTQIRLDPDVLFPAIAIARGDMLEYQSGFQTALSLALHDETEQPDGDARVRELLNEIRYAWSQMIAAYRLYLINRIASLAESHLDIQAQDVHTIHESVAELLAELAELDRQGRVGLVASSNLETLQEVAELWYAGFERVVAINLTDGWRADVPYFRETIEPLLGAISARIGVLDAMLTEAGRQDVADVAGVATRVSVGLWWAALALLALIAIGLYMFERTVLRPFAYLADALKKEALGAEKVPLPAATTHETQDLVTAFSELQRQIRARQTELEHQALHDSLTALPNRTLLRDRLNQAVASAHRERGSLALLMIDLDRFKQINDTLGHPVGDRVLQQVARRLTGLLRESDTVARLGGDEFAILLPNAGRSEAEGVAHKVLRALESPLAVGEHQLVVGASLGIALYPQHGRSADTLVQHADIAMYAAKRGRTGWLMYGNDARAMGTPS